MAPSCTLRIENRDPRVTSSIMASFGQGPQIKLQQTIDRYRRLSELHPAVAVLLRSSDFHQAFVRVMHHERDIINTRSSDLKDHEITIAQKAFAILMQREETHHAAVQIYVDELLGVRFGAVADRNSMIQDAVHVRSAFLEGMPKS